MKNRCLIAIAGLLCAGTVPAFAEWNHVGDLEVSPTHYSNVELGNFTGPVEQLRMHSSGRSDCDNVRVTYANGDTQQVFAGTILDDEDQIITFPNQSRRIEGVSLNCRAESDAAHISIAADIPAFRAADNYGPPTGYAPDMVLLATRDFGDLDQRSLMLTPAPRPMEAIALQPIGADARCSNVSAQFADGSTSRAIPNDGDDLMQGQIYRTYVGAGSDLDSVNLTCEAANGDHVRVNVYAIG